MSPEVKFNVLNRAIKLARTPYWNKLPDSAKVGLILKVLTSQIERTKEKGEDISGLLEILIKVNKAYTWQEILNLRNKWKNDRDLEVIQSQNDSNS